MSKKGTSYLISFAVHLILLLIFYFIKVSLGTVEDEYITVGFGSIGKLSSSGILAKSKTEEVQKKQPEMENTQEEKKAVKKVDLPKVKNSDETNNVIAASKKKKEEKETTPRKVKPVVKDEKESGKGKEESGEGEGNFGFEIKFGGKGKRKIYSYSLPAYPQGVAKEIDVKLKFTILADGTVGNILPLIKADTRLELAAINSLKQWRFEPLPEEQKNQKQTAVIIFPFRLK